MKKLLSPTNTGTWKRLIIYCVSFTGVFFIGVAIDMACGPEPDPYDYYVSFFHNTIQKNDEYQPFYFNGFTFLNGNFYENDEKEKAKEQEVNAGEWAMYLGNGVKKTDVEHAMYRLPDSVESIVYNKYLVYHKLPDSLKQNTFLKSLVSPAKKPALIYYLFSESVENLTRSDNDRWNPVRPDSVALSKRAAEALTAAGRENDRFLKLRYYYQAQRLLQYAQNAKAALNIYEERIANANSGSHVMMWALSLKAGEEQMLGHRAVAEYLFSKIFANCPEKRLRAYYGFLSINVKLPDVAKLAKNNSEKSFIYAIASFDNRHISLSTLKKVYKLDPKSNLVSILLVREINKVEEGYLTPKLNGKKYYDSIGYYDHDKYDSVKASFVNYIPKLKAFCNGLATGHKYTEPGLGNLASAYLSWIQHDPEAGFRELAALKNKPLSASLYDEKQLVNLLLLSQSIKKLDKTTESRLLPSLLWLDKKVRQETASTKDDKAWWGDYDFKYYSASSRDFYEKVLSRMYLNQKDTARAALCILRSERTISLLPTYAWSNYPEHGLGFDMPYFWQTAMHSYHFEKILRWERSPVKTPYLSLLMADLHMATQRKMFSWEQLKNGNQLRSSFTEPKVATLPAIYDLLGTAYLREHKYDKAVNAFKHIAIKQLEHSTSDAYNDSLSVHYNLYTNPFVDEMRDYRYSASTKKVAGYNKLAYAEVMAGLQRKIKTNPKTAAECYYKMANGLYNTSYYGSTWIYTAYSWADEDRYHPKGLYYDADYLREQTAERYFLKASQLSHDPEFKARCTFMAAKCRQKKIPLSENSEDEFEALKFGIDFKIRSNSYSKAVRNNFYFKDLKNHYSKTAFYKLAVSECSYFRDFLKSNAK